MKLTDVKMGALSVAHSYMGSATERREYCKKLSNSIQTLAQKDVWLNRRDLYDCDLLADDYLTVKRLHEKAHSLISELLVRPYFRDEEDNVLEAAGIFAEMIWHSAQYGINPDHKPGRKRKVNA